MTISGKINGESGIHMNVLVLGARVIGPALARELAAAFVHATFSGEERYVRRLNKVKALEKQG